MERRTLLKTAGGIAGTATVGGLGLFALSGGAAASADGTFNYGSVDVTTDDGTVDHVSIYGDSIIEWSGFENDAESVDVTIKAKVDGEMDYQELYTTSADLTQESWGGSGEDHSGVGTSGTISSNIGLDEDGNHDPATDWAIVQSDDHDDEYGIPSNENALDASHLEVDGDGDGPENFTISVKATYMWNDADGNEEFTESFTSTVNVNLTNEPRNASSEDGDGEDGVVAG